MGLIWRRRIPVNRTTHVNLSRSGASVTKRLGRLTVNSRGRVSFRLGHGLYFRKGR